MPQIGTHLCHQCRLRVTIDVSATPRPLRGGREEKAHPIAGCNVKSNAHTHRIPTLIPLPTHDVVPLKGADTKSLRYLQTTCCVHLPLVTEEGLYSCQPTTMFSRLLSIFNGSLAKFSSNKGLGAIST